MQTYPFLVLSLLCMVPAAVVWVFRPGLRRPMAVTALCALPFAATERFFYPSYWEPAFLFNLIHVIGFGIEDLLFVTGLGAGACCAYPVVAKTIPAGGTREPRHLLVRALPLVGISLGAALVLYNAGLPMLYVSWAVMVAAGSAMGAVRRDLVLPGLVGAVVTVVAYGLLCVLLELLTPGVFSSNWHTEAYLNRFIWTIPVEELVYAVCAGFAGTVFYPFITGMHFEPLEGTRS